LNLFWNSEVKAAYKDSDLIK